ncbi:TIGR02301 family protein [Devosia sp. A16]|uniref:TIGR02301 family protein n=1 Tax=Devosia sp. A16 TaxID=1736675 RepID=UPI0006D762B8|nr:TIGR02301 family protein [Devosia sp. A16]
MRLRPLCFVLITLLLTAGPARAIDPPYQAEMERLSEILGSLYFLYPLCKPGAGSDWRGEMADLIALDEPDDDRKQRLTGAFNSGYEAYARLYRVCTVSAQQAMSRLLVEAEKTAREIHSRYAE